MNRQAAPNRSAISVRGLTKRFKKTTALHALDLEIAPGTAVGILGGSGAGKSTLVRVLSGLALPTAGNAWILGERASSTKARRRLGVLLQDAPLYGWMRAREVLAFAADLAHVDAHKLAARVTEVARLLGVEGVLDRRVTDLPPDLAGRLSVAQAIVGDPDVLLLDEPFHWIDPEARHQGLEVLAGQRGSKTTLVLGHRWADIRATCDRVVVLDAGRIAFDGATAEVARRVASVFVVETGTAPGIALAGVVARLRAAPWVRGVTANGGTLRITASDPDRAARDLLPAFIGAGMPVSAVRREEASLEQLVAGVTRR